MEGIHGKTLSENFTDSEHLCFSYQEIEINLLILNNKNNMAFELLIRGWREEKAGNYDSRFEKPGVSTLETNMNLKQSTLAIAVSAALGVGMAGNAFSAIYGGAHLNIQDLTILIQNDNGSLATINTFDFRTSTASDLNGVLGVGDVDTCFGTIAANNCGAAGAGNVLNSSPSSIGTVRVDNTFTFLGPGGGQYGSSDNVIRDASLVGDASTAVEGIAEAELTSGTTAGATSTIRSTTGFTFTFTLSGTGSFQLRFNADPDMYAELIDGTASGGTASATLATTFQLTGAGNSISWAPVGTVSDNCFELLGAATCSETNDTQNLNGDVTAPFGGSDTRSFDPAAVTLTAFGINITGLNAGTYSFTLAATQEANVTRTAAVPEPGALSLFGASLVGLGIVARRRARKS